MLQLALSGDLSGEGGDFDRHLAADYLRLIGDKDTPEARFFKEKGVKAAEAPEGFLYTIMERPVFSVAENGW